MFHRPPNFLIRALTGIALTLLAGCARADGLGLMETMVSWRYHVAQIDGRELQAMVKRDPPLIFDSRSAEEFAVSHLPSAIRVDAGTSSEQFASAFGSQVRGRDLVFYCSVGVRSSGLADRVATAIEAAGAKKLYNLRGGIFRWQADKLPLENDKGATDWVHPFDATWGRLAPRQDRLIRTPVESGN